MVPEGKGKLVMHTTVVGEEKEEEDNVSEEEEEEVRGNRKKRKKTSKNRKETGKKRKTEIGGKKGKRIYSGVGVKVSFTGSDQHQNIGQLSGGQKTVVALAIIFAIQRCDPSPFYLFDEIDSNLDDVHRTSVARMITAQSDTTQFITTTFRSEMLVNANQFLGVAFVNKASRASEITREEARQLASVQERERERANEVKQNRRQIRPKAPVVTSEPEEDDNEEDMDEEETEPEPETALSRGNRKRKQRR